MVTKVVRCTCGVELRDESDDALVENVQRHAREAHELELSREQVMSMMEIEQ